MFKDISELKEFIKWAKAEKVVRVKTEQVEFEISALGLIDEERSQNMEDSISKALGLTPSSPEQAMKDDEDLLFHSSN
jgi:hypothetical protein